MSSFPRYAVPVWVVAAAVAAFPTWDERRFEVQPGDIRVLSCVRPFSWDASLPVTVRADLDRLMTDLVAWAVPALLVAVAFVACLGGRDPRRVGRRTAGALALIAVVGPATPLYSHDEPCAGTLPIFAAEWFATVLGAWGSTQVCLLGAAALVLLATHHAKHPADGAHPTDGGLTWRRLAAVLADYAIIITVVAYAVQPLLGFSVFYLDSGLLHLAALPPDNLDADRLAVLLGVFLYFWVQHGWWGRTVGQCLLGVRVVSAGTAERPAAARAALRALLFPMLLFEPAAGALVLVADALWALLDPYGRPLHDRIARTEVTRPVAPAAAPRPSGHHSSPP